MDNLRKVNAFAGEVIKDVNTDVTDDQLNTFVGMTIDEYISALALLPERFKKLPLSVFMDFVLVDDEDELGKILEEFGFDSDLTNEEENALNAFIEAVGLSDSN